MKFGRNQAIGLGALIVPFGVATATMVWGDTSFIEWADFTKWHIPLVCGITLGGSAVAKVGKV